MPNDTVPVAGPGLPMSTVQLADKLNSIADRAAVLTLAIYGLGISGAGRSDFSALAGVAEQIDDDLRELAETVHPAPEAS